MKQERTATSRTVPFTHRSVATHITRRWSQVLRNRRLCARGPRTHGLRTTARGTDSHQTPEWTWVAPAVSDLSGAVVHGWVILLGSVTSPGSKRGNPKGPCPRVSIYLQSLCRCEEVRVHSVRETSNLITGGVIKGPQTQTHKGKGTRRTHRRSQQKPHGQTRSVQRGTWPRDKVPRGPPEATSSWERGRQQSVPWSPQTEAAPLTL